MMCEVPSNAMLADEFLEHLRRLLDRLERPDPAHARPRPRLRHRRRRCFDERDPAVKTLLSMAIAGLPRDKASTSASAARGRPIIRTSPSG